DFKEEISGTSPFVHYETMVKRGALMHSVLVRGFDPIKREKVQSLRPWIEPKSCLDALASETKDKLPQVPSIIVGEGVLSILDAKVGDTLEMISPTSNDFSSFKTFKIVGTYHSGLKHYDNRLIAMSLASAQNFFGLGARVTGLEIGLHEPDD